MNAKSHRYRKDYKAIRRVVQQKEHKVLHVSHANAVVDPPTVHEEGFSLLAVVIHFQDAYVALAAVMGSERLHLVALASAEPIE